MKNQILDVPFRNSFPDFLKKGETIIWEGQPTHISQADPFSKKDGYENYTYWTAIILVVAFFLFTTNFSISGVIFTIGVIIIAFIIPFYRKRKKNNIRYAITQDQILFQFKNYLGTQQTFHSISFSEIKNIVVVKRYNFEQMKKLFEEANREFVLPHNADELEKIGTIYLALHHPEQIDFETTNLENNNKRHQPTLELIDDVQEIADKIREGIRNAI